jgi:hypothetical protein
VNLTFDEKPEAKRHAAELVSSKLFPTSVILLPPPADIIRGTVLVTIGDMKISIFALCDHCGARFASALKDTANV